MEIKKREVIASIVIIAIMLIIGFSISNSIRQNLLEKYHEYDTAIHIDKEELFRYGMRTSIGHAFAYGVLDLGHNENRTASRNKNRISKC